MRQYISQRNLDSSGLLTIIGKDFRYLRSVLRLIPGDMVYVRLPNGSLQSMTVCACDDKAKKIILQICEPSLAKEGEKQPEETELIESCQFFLFMALPKSSKLDMIIRQATECGVKRIIPVQTEFSQKGSEKINFHSDRFDRIIKEARQQSGSPVSTEIGPCITFEDACEIWKAESAGLTDDEKLAVVLYERNESSITIKEACGGKEKAKKAALFCGSEGGLSPREVHELKEAGFASVHLKTNILRCETAALYGLAAMQALL